jgi:AraC family transcriptional regulator
MKIEPITTEGSRADDSVMVVERAIEHMYLGLESQLSIDDLARTAILSKFYFSRVFRQTTGLSPGRFLSAIRLQAAKWLLSSTSQPIADVCFAVGYNSVGTFSSRFKFAVGIPPSIYRESGGLISGLRVNKRGDCRIFGAPIRGSIYAHEASVSNIFVGVFPDAIMKGLPIRYKILHRPGHYVLDPLPQGTWYLLAHASLPSKESHVPPNGESPPLIGSFGPIVVGHRGLMRPLDIRLRQMRMIDPPVLLALPDLRVSCHHTEALRTLL